METGRFGELAATILDRPPFLGDVRVVAVDGGTGAGKSTVASALERAFAGLGASTHVLHTDDLLDGWSDLEGSGRRLAELVLTPLAEGRPAAYPAYDWHASRFGDRLRHVGRPDVLILEGVGSARRANRPHLTFAVFVEAPLALRRERVLARDGEQVAGPLRRWIAEETAHFTAQGTRAAADVVMDGRARVGHDHEAEYVRLDPPPGQGA
jgi:uridine kinase